MQASKPMKSVMLALAPEDFPALLDVWQHRYRLHSPKSVALAQRLLERFPVDLIVCGALFDESRLLDLLQFCKSSPALAHIPFVGLRIRRGRLPIDSFRDLVMASSALGAAAFIDLDQWEKSMGEAQAMQQLERVVDDLLSA
jgi:hypothetical protein